MPKKRVTAYMSPGEQIAGTVFFVIYLLVLPFAADPLFALAGRLLGLSLSRAVKTAVCYYILFAVTLVIFHGFLARTSRRLAEDLGETLKTAGVGLVALYGLNELASQLGGILFPGLLFAGRANLNDGAVTYQLDSAPHMTLVIVLLLAPFVEEVLFRGLVFGNLKYKSRALAYLVSCLLFALLHVLQFAVLRRDAAYLLVMIQYLVPGLVLAWACDHSGTIWAPFAIHALANALSVWTMG